MHGNRLVALLAIANLSLLVSAVRGQASNPVQRDDLAAGVVIEKVTSSSDPTQSYALYLPSTYTPTRKFPILYCFDPGARGAFPVNRFKEAAEKYNYIVVGSNISRNFATQPLSKTMSNL